MSYKNRQGVLVEASFLKGFTVRKAVLAVWGLALAGMGSAAQAAPDPDADTVLSASTHANDNPMLEEIIVTGTLIRGVKPTGSQTLEIDVGTIEISGAKSANEILGTLIHGPMNKVVMGSTHYMTDEDLRAIAVYLKGIPPRSQSSETVVDDEVLAAGKITYTVHCGSCHLPTGLGSDILGVPLAGNSLVQAPDPSTLINVILYGPDLPPPPFLSDRSRMKMYGKRLSDEDIANVSTYIRSSFGNSAGAVSPEQVGRQR